MAEQGQYNASCAVYGYRKSKEDKHKLEIEPEEAKIVKEIFVMKIAGMGTAHIAQVLNDRNIPCPFEMYRLQGDMRKWAKTGSKCYWITNMIERIIRNEVYIGTTVQLKTKTETVGGRQIKRPKEEWVRVENTHEAIVSYSQYIKAVSSLKQQKAKQRKWKGNGRKCYWIASMIERIIRNEVYTGTMVQLKTKTETVGGRQIKKPKEEWVRVENTYEAIVSYSQYIMAVSSLKQQKATERRQQKNIYYCGCCGRALFNMHCGTVFCRQRSYKTDSVCKEIQIRKEDADKAVLEAVKQQAALYLDRDKLSKQVIKRKSSLSVGTKINALIMAMETAQQGWIALNVNFAYGKLDRNDFISEKKKYDADMEHMEEELAALRQRQEEEKAVQRDSGKNVAEALVFLEENELTEDMKDKLIEKVLVFEEGRIEVVWKFGNNVEILNIG